jgi:hypothetical protein
VTRHVTVEMSPFSRESVEEQAARQRIPVSDLLRHAVLHYLAEAESGRVAAKLPRFSRVAPVGEEHVAIDVDLDDAEWEAFGTAASNAGVQRDRLLGHAALLYLADLDAGIVARRLVDDGDDA